MRFRAVALPDPISKQVKRLPAANEQGNEPSRSLPNRQGVPAAREMREERDGNSGGRAQFLDR